MKRINNNGFTLIELLGVIVILLLILSLVLPKIISGVKSKEPKIENLKESIVYQAAKLYLDETVINPTTGATYCVPINNLVSKKMLAYDEKYASKYVVAVYNYGYDYQISSSCSGS